MWQTHRGHSQEPCLPGWCEGLPRSPGCELSQLPCPPLAQPRSMSFPTRPVSQVPTAHREPLMEGWHLPRARGKEYKSTRLVFSTFYSVMRFRHLFSAMKQPFPTALSPPRAASRPEGLTSSRGASSHGFSFPLHDLFFLCLTTVPKYLGEVGP